MNHEQCLTDATLMLLQSLADLRSAVWALVFVVAVAVCADLWMSALHLRQNRKVAVRW